MLMRKLLTFLTLLVLAYSVGWAEETVYYTLTPASGTNNSYDGNCDVAVNNITWNVEGNAQQVPWRIGGKSKTNQDRKVSSKTPMGSAISKVTLELGAANSVTLNSLKLQVASDAEFSTILDTRTITSPAANTTHTFTPTSGTEWATGAYYRFVFNITITSTSNKYVVFTSASFYQNEGTTPVTTYTVTAKTGLSNGSISVSPAPAAEGTKVTVTGTPTSDAYYMSAVTVTPEGGTAFAATIDSSVPNKATFTMPASNVEVEATFTAKPTYAVNVTQPASGGTVSVSSTSAYEGQTVTVTATPTTADYVLDEITVTGNTSGNNITVTGNTFTMPAEAVTVSATFKDAPNEATIVFDATSAGSNAISAGGTYAFMDMISSGASYVASVSSVSKTYNKDGCIRISTGSEAGAFTLNFSNEISGKIVTQIIVNAAGWSASEAGSFSLSSGETELTSSNVTPSGTTLQDYTITLTTPQALSSLTFTGVGGSRTLIKSITLVFQAAKDYDVTVTQATGGTITASPFGPGVADEDDLITLSYTEATGYEFGSWNVTGDTSGAPVTVTNNSFRMPAESVTVTATFNQIVTYGVTVAQAEGGTISASPTAAREGATITLTATPDDAHTFGSWNVYKTGESSTTVSVSDNSFTMPAYDVTVTATFTAKPTFAVNVTQPSSGGTVSVDHTSAYEGQIVTVTATPTDATYLLNEITVDGVVLPGNTFTMPGHAVTVTASFQKNVTGTATFVAGTDKGSTTEQSADSMTKGVVSFSSTNAALATDEYRLYGSSTNTFTVPTGYLIKSIVFTGLGSGTRKVDGIADHEGLVKDTENDVATWTGSAASVSFTTTAQVRLNTITVTYAMPESEPETITVVMKNNGSVSDGSSVAYGGNLTNWTGTTNDPSFGAVPGTNVTFEAQTYPTYSIYAENISIVDADDNAVEFSMNSSNVVSFTMPNSAVTITANFTTYRGTLRLAGRFNGGTETGDDARWVSDTSGPAFTYDPVNDRYTLDAYFIGASTENGSAVDYFYFRYQEGSDPASDVKAPNGIGDNYGINGDNMSQTHNLGSERNFSIIPGVYTITVNGARTTMNVTKITPTLTFTPASGSEAYVGTSVTATSTLTDLVDAIKAGDSGAKGTVTVEVSGDQSTWGADYTFASSDVSSDKIVYGRATIGNITASDHAIYNVVAPDETATYTLVSDVSELTAGDEIIIASSNSAGSAYAMGEAQANNFYGTAVTIQSISDEKKIVGPTGVTALTLESANPDGWYFRTPDDQYLYAASSSSNYLKAGTDKDDNYRATISISNDAATVTFQGTNSRKVLQYNGNGENKIFSCYTGGQSPVYIYRKALPEGANLINVVNQYIDGSNNTVVGSTGGTITASARYAFYGDQITVDVNAETGYQLQSLTYSWNNGGSSGDITDLLGFAMPGSETTVTATFAKKPFAIAYTSDHGTVTGPSQAVMGETVSFSITPDAGYNLVSVTGTYNGNNALTLEGSGTGPYTFGMPPFDDVEIIVNYYAPEKFEVVDDLADINSTDPYLIVGYNGSSSKYYAMGYKNGSNNYADAIEVTPDAKNLIESTADMVIVTFEPGEGENEWAIRAQGRYLSNNGTANEIAYDKSIENNYVTITKDASNDVTLERLVNDGSNRYLHFYSNNPRWAFYSADAGVQYIYKLAATNQVKRPSVVGIGTAKTIGKYKFIGADELTMECSTEGATIMYKIGDETDWHEYDAANKPTISSATVGETVAVHTKAVKSGMDDSYEVTATFTCIAPSWNESAFGDNWDGTSKTFYNPMFIYPKSALSNRRAYGEENVHFRYTTDGTTPTAASTLLTSSNSSGYYFFLDATTQLKVVVEVNGVVSEVKGGTLTFMPAAPAISLEGGNYAGDQEVRLSTDTKTQQNNARWNTYVYYTTGSGVGPFAFDSATGTVTNSSEDAKTGWKLYDADNDPYIDILVEDGTTMLRAVTLTNFYGGEYSGSATALNGEWRASTTSSATYVLTLANLDVIFSPAGGTYLYTKDVTLTPKNGIGEVTMTYDLTWASPDANHVDLTGADYTGAIHIDQDATITVHATDSRDSSLDGKNYSTSHEYKIGVQEPLFSPYPGEYPGAGDYYVLPEGDSEAAIEVEIFDVSPNAKIYYTCSPNELDDYNTIPPTPTSSSTLYTGPIKLTAGHTYVFSAIAYVGDKASTVRTRAFTVRENSETGNYWYSLAEMNADEDHSTEKTLANPIEVIYMSTHHNNGVTPEFAFVRDNSGYGYIYFGNGNTAYDNWHLYQPGDWIKGKTISGTSKVWGNSYMNELMPTEGSTSKAKWDAGYLDNRPLVPETTTCKAIRDGWSYDNGVNTGVFTGQAYPEAADNSNNYKPFVTAKDIFGHYVHLRKNLITNVTGAGGGNGKHSGTITGELGVPLCYYDGLYLFSGFGSGDDVKDYDQQFFNKVQSRGGTFDLYAIVYFYGPYAKNSTWENAPYEVFPLGFDYIFPPIFNLAGDASASDMTNHNPERTIYAPSTVTLECETRGAQIWYKTSDMDDYAIYTAGTQIPVNKTTVISTYSTHSTEYFDELESVVRTLTINLGSVDQPVITTPSTVKAEGESIGTTITCATEGATIWYTTDGSDPSDDTNAERIEYTAGKTLTFTKTTTVRAIAEMDGFYSVEAESKTYTFVKSNGIVYNLVKSAADLSPDYVYVIVNKQYNMAVLRTQDTDNRKGSGVKFLESGETGYTGEKEQVYGNDDLAMFTLINVNGNWVLHTANGVNNASIGYMYANKSGTTNQWKSEFTLNDDIRAYASITIDGANSDVNKAYAAHVTYTGSSDGARYLRFNKSYDLFNTYSSEMTGQEVFLYYKEAWPLAKIEKVGEPGRDRGYTIADELVGVYANGTKLWVKDQGNVSISKTEKPDEWIDYVDQMWPVNIYGGNWDQSNWVSLDFGTVPGISAGDAEDLAQSGVGKLIAPATITARYVDGVNYAMEVQSYGGETLAINGDATGQYSVDEATTKANIVTPANFNSNYTAGEGVSVASGRTYYFLNPKVQEVVLVNNVTWDGTRFVISAPSGTHNTADLDGAIDVDWSLCDNFDATSGPAALNQAMSNDENIEFKFLAVVKVATGGGSGAPRRAPKTESGATSNLLIAPTSLDLDNGVYTDVTDVKVEGREVKAVKYVDVVGRVSGRPFEGLNIIVTEYTDGSVETVKVIK